MTPDMKYSDINEDKDYRVENGIELMLKRELMTQKKTARFTEEILPDGNYIIRESSKVVETVEGESLLDKGQVLKNFRYLLDRSIYKIGEIELESKNTKGYVSRLESPNNTSFPNMNFLITISKKFNISLDLLIKGKLDTLTSEENILISFVEKLNHDTSENVLEWNRIEKLSKSKFSAIDYYSFTQELFRDVAFSHATIQSIVDDHVYTACGEVYRAFLPDNENAVYLVHVETTDKDRKMKAEEYYDVFLEDTNGNTIELCDMIEMNQTVKLSVENLYAEVMNSSKRVRISERARDIIGNYLGY